MKKKKRTTIIHNTISIYKYVETQKTFSWLCKTYIFWLMARPGLANLLIK